MQEKTEALWSPAGITLPSLGSRSLVSVSDGDALNIRMPIRILSIDTPEVTARSTKGAAKVDAQFKDLVNRKLTRVSDRKHNLFVRSPEQPFDSYGRLLTYIAPGYSTQDRAKMTRRERATSNLIWSTAVGRRLLFFSPAFRADWVYHSLSRRQKMPSNTIEGNIKIRCHCLVTNTACVKSCMTSAKNSGGNEISRETTIARASAYCVDMRTRQIFGPENYMNIPAPYRLWIWPDDVQKAIGQLNLIPA